MLELLLNWVVSALVIMVAAYLLPGVTVKSFVTALAVVVVLALVNALLKPLIVFLTLPLTIVTFGLFLFVINALMLMLVSAIIPGFNVGGFLNALLFSLIISVINLVVNSNALS